MATEVKSARKPLPCLVAGCSGYREPKTPICIKCQLLGLRAPYERKERPRL